MLSQVQQALRHRSGCQRAAGVAVAQVLGLLGVQCGAAMLRERDVVDDQRGQESGTVERHVRPIAPFKTRGDDAVLLAIGCVALSMWVSGLRWPIWVGAAVGMSAYLIGIGLVLWRSDRDRT